MGHRGLPARPTPSLHSEGQRTLSRLPLPPPSGRGKVPAGRLAPKGGWEGSWVNSYLGSPSQRPESAWSWGLHLSSTNQTACFGGFLDQTGTLPPPWGTQGPPEGGAVLSDTELPSDSLTNTEKPVLRL